MSTHRDTKSACERVRGRLEELIDGGLGELETARDEGHLEVCDACGTERGRRRRWLEELAAAAAPGPDQLQAALEGLDERLAQARPPGRRRLRLLSGGGARRAGLAAALAASALLALALLQGLAATEVPLEDLLASSLDGFDVSGLPEIRWPADPGHLMGGR